jgi:hypothetical protein
LTVLKAGNHGADDALLTLLDLSSG